LKIYNVTRDRCLADTAIMSDNFFSRLRGLMGRSSLPSGCCMVIKPCRSIHTMFMRFSLDVLFVDRRNKVVAMVCDLSPFRFSRYIKQACLAIEFPAGSLKSTGTVPGDLIEIMMHK